MPYNYKDTDFLDNGIGIDPEGCGCTDCIIGYSFNMGSVVYDSDLAKDIIRGRKLYNRTSTKIRVEIVGDAVQFFEERYNPPKFVTYLDAR